MSRKKKLVEQIVAEEWKLFDQVQNQGCRASCQDDWETFSIMRKSQYLTWTEELLESFYNDIQNAKAEGRNIITEKYARMMESTAPQAYEELKENLPYINEEKKQIINQIVEIQVNWMEIFAKQYPKLSVQARVIHTAEDTQFETSYETYLRGEMSTYSDHTLLLYGQYIATLFKEGKNLANLIMEQTSKLYGYQSLEEAEAYISQ